ncbi:hypothetical protein [Klebsiella phage vB_KshKPC-M]|nr:hypothetical protein [Klebsiella phage vB_KshKPC-M]
MFLARAHRALAMYAFSKNILSVLVEFNNISISGYVGGSYHVTKFSFPSLDSLEREALGFGIA